VTPLAVSLLVPQPEPGCPAPQKRKELDGLHGVPIGQKCPNVKGALSPCVGIAQ
jgi:hypothetical protein